MMSNPLSIQEPRQKRADALENYSLLLETAWRLIAEQGVENVSMTSIAEAAGVGKGTLYRHFPKGKIEILQALLDHEQRDLQARTFAHLNAGGSAAEHLRWFVGEIYAFVNRNLPLMGYGANAPGFSFLDHPAHFWWRMTIRGLLMSANPQIDVDYSADLLYVMLDPRTIDFQRNHLGYDVDRVTNGLLSTLERILAAS